MTVEFQTSGVVLPASKNLMLAWLMKAMPAGAAKSGGHITVRFVGSVEGRQLNYNYRKKNYPTNVLTFAYTARPICADLVLCMPVVRREARERQLSLQDHLAHLLVHGCLHAQGYDHESAEQARIMENREKQILRHFGIADPYRVAD
jgi:probable rRNA maturation factor